MTATLGPGLRGPEAERALGARGFTVGHFPQSFEYATIGGFAATRSAGQASSGYGRFDELVTALAIATPIGELRTLLDAAHRRRARAARAGARLRGSARRDHRGHRAGAAGAAARAVTRPGSPSDFAAGAEIVRSLAQADALPDVTRLSDEEETRISLALVGRRRRADARRSTPICDCAGAPAAA